MPSYCDSCNRKRLFWDKIYYTPKRRVEDWLYGVKKKFGYKPKGSYPIDYNRHTGEDGTPDDRAYEDYWNGGDNRLP